MMSVCLSVPKGLFFVIHLSLHVCDDEKEREHLLQCPVYQKPLLPTLFDSCSTLPISNPPSPYSILIKIQEKKKSKYVQ